MRRLLTRFVLRLAASVFVLWCVFTLSFVLLELVPGGPFSQVESLDPAAASMLDKRFGLDQPYFSRYWAALRGAVVGDFGPSLRVSPGRDVGELVTDSAPVSLAVGLLAFLIAVTLGSGLGILAGYSHHRGRSFWGRALDHGLTALTLMVLCLSVIVLSAVFRYVFVVKLKVLTLGGTHLSSLVLPVVVLGLSYAALYARLIRSSTISFIASPRYRALQARGIRDRALATRYLLPEVLIPMISYLAPSFAGILTGSFVVERIFDLPGLSWLFVQGALTRDYPVVMGGTVFYTVLLLTLGLLGDTLRNWLDPRLRSGQGGTT